MRSGQGDVMKKKALASLNLTYDEYVFLLRLWLAQSESAGISGLAVPMEEPDLRKKQMIWDALKKRGILYQAKDGLHMDANASGFIRGIIDSPDFLSLNKPSYQEKKRLITVYSTNGYFIWADQNASENTADLLLFDNEEETCAFAQPVLEEKDVPRRLKRKAFDGIFAEQGIGLTYDKKAKTILEITRGFNNGKAIKNISLYFINKTGFTVYSGLDTQRVVQESQGIEKLREAFSKELTAIRTPRKKKEEGGRKNYKDPEQEEKYSYHKLTDNPGFPKSRMAFFFWFVKNLIVLFFKNWKRSFLKLLAALGISGLGILWNLYGACYLNDTFWFDRKQRWGELTPYLFGGLLGSDTYGLGSIGSDSALLAGSLYYLLVLFVWTAGVHMFKKGPLGILKELGRVPGMTKQYFREQTRTGGYYLCKGLFYASVFGLLITNPLSVAVLGILLLASYTMGDESRLACFLMMWRSAGAYKKVEKHVADAPLYSELKLSIGGMGAGFLLYALLNLFLWKLLAYDLWARILFSILLCAAALLLSGKPVSKKNKHLLTLVLLTAAAGLLVHWNGYLPVLADDGGWSESGRTLKGLLANSGFSTILGLSVLVGLCVLGAPFTAAVIAGAATLGTAFVLANTNEYVARSADAFIYGKYSDYDPTLLSTAANMLVGIVPGVGDVWSLTAGTRDLTYDLPNGDYLGAAFDLLAIGHGINGLKNGNLKKAWDAAKESFEKSLGQSVPKETITGISDLTREQYEALERYTTNEYRNINGSLRGQEIATAENQEAIKQMQSALSKASLGEDMTLYRGSCIEELGSSLQGLSPEELVGRTYIQQGFMSTSASELVAKNNFHGNLFVKVLAEKGANGLDISSLSAFPNEAEILFNAGQEMLIEGAEWIDGVLHLIVTLK